MENLPDDGATTQTLPGREAIYRVGRAHEEPREAHPCAAATGQGGLQLLHLRHGRRGPYSPYMQQNAYANQLSQYGRASTGYQSSRHWPSATRAHTASSSPTVKAHSPQSSTWNPSYSNLGSAWREARRAAGGSHRGSVTSLPRRPFQPTPHHSGRRYCSNPEPGNDTTWRPRRTAVQRIRAVPAQGEAGAAGDLDAMARNWTEEEWERSDGSVHFKRSQSGSTITTGNSSRDVGGPATGQHLHQLHLLEAQRCFVTTWTPSFCWSS